ncbi:unnamed protein product [Bursaphelenchus okinawaensis]|uniref:Copper transport protein n=1 Tax=Bursaphelenchus okinawaensis TaxID=465554 RepID=A0A811L0B8_9BILA|nr:unnamed protein product [Bursaphelenchus okinawaensis]CAG9113896.1 unnamed protein product [Bursaphelenchus okinawaensis]
MMWMYFHTKVDDTVLFNFWKVNSTIDMVGTCAIIFVAAVFLEFIKYLRIVIEQRHQDKIAPNTPFCLRLFSPFHFLHTVLFSIQIVLSYLLMLVFMTFSIWLGLAIAVGAGVGYFIFGARPTGQSSSEAVLIGHSTHN